MSVELRYNMSEPSATGGRVRGARHRRAEGDRSRAHRVHPDAARGAHVSPWATRCPSAVSGTYRTKAELEEHEARPDRAVAHAHVMEHGELSDELHGWTDEIKAVVQDAWDFADKSPEPPLEALYEDVYVDTTSDAAGDAVA